MSGQPGSIPADRLLEHAGFLSRLARELVGDEHRAADLVQEAYVSALERPPRDGRSLRGWLAIVVANLARDERRGAARRARREELAARPERIEPGELSLARLEIQRVILDLVLTLPEEKRTVLYLRYYEGLAPSAIAARLGMPVKTVKTRHTRALAELRERLDARSEGNRTAWMSALLPLVRPGGSAIPGGGALMGILGGVAMKKLAVAIGVLLAAWLVWQGTGGRARPSEKSTRAEEPGVALLQAAGPEKVAELGEPDPAPARIEVRSPIAAQKPATTGGLIVRLTWSDGAPAADIGIEATCENDPAPREESLRSCTDDTGSARFASLFAGPVRFVLDRGVRFEDEVVAGETRSIEARIPAGIDVEGVVLDPGGNPVGGAEIWSEGLHWSWPSGRLLAKSAADGSFRLRSLGEEGRFEGRFGAQARGFRPSLVFVPAGLPVGPRGTRTVTLELGPSGGRVEGRVLDPDGTPVAGALVHAGDRGGYTTDLPSGLRGYTAGPVPVETGADGAFVLPGDLEPGYQPIHAMARGFPLWQGNLELEDAETAFVEIRLQRAATIEGRVVTAAGEPVAEASVVAAHEERGGWYSHSFPPSRARTDGAGRFVLGWVAPGQCELNASAEARLGKAQELVTCAAGETTNCELVLDLGQTISGRVVDASGRPLAGWNVYDEPVQRGSVYPRQDATDEDGRFLLTNVGDCAHDLLVSARYESPVPPRAKLENVRPGASELVLVVEDARLGSGSYHGVLLGADGKPPQDVELVIYPESGDTGHFVELDRTSGAFAGQALPGRYVLRADRGGSTVARSEPFEVLEGIEVNAGTLSIAIPGRLEVTVLGLPSQALEKLSFWLDRPQGSSEELVLEGGVLRSRELAPGTWIVKMAERELYLRGHNALVVSGETTRVEVEVERAYPFQLTCSFAREGWSQVTLEARDDEDMLLDSQIWFPAAFRSTMEVLLHLPQGTATIAARTDTGLAAEIEVEVGPALFGAAPFALALK